eukprot:4615572-Pyramimonas_sp.AAC.1
MRYSSGDEDDVPPVDVPNNQPLVERADYLASDRSDSQFVVKSHVRSMPCHARGALGSDPECCSIFVWGSRVLWHGEGGVSTAEDLADTLTKCVGSDIIMALMRDTGQFALEGRHRLAPVPKCRASAAVGAAAFQWRASAAPPPSAQQGPAAAVGLRAGEGVTGVHFPERLPRQTFIMDRMGRAFDAVEGVARRVGKLRRAICRLATDV